MGPGEYGIMNRLAIRFGFAVVAAFVLGGAPAPAATSGCDAACWSHYMDDYLAALAAHDASRLPVAPHVRFTENGIATR